MCVCLSAKVRHVVKLLAMPGKIEDMVSQKFHNNGIPLKRCNGLIYVVKTNFLTACSKRGGLRTRADGDTRS